MNEYIEILRGLSKRWGTPIVNIENRLAFVRDYCGEIVAAWLSEKKIEYLLVDEIIRGLAEQKPCLEPKTIEKIIEMLEHNLVESTSWMITPKFMRKVANKLRELATKIEEKAKEYERKEKTHEH